MSENAISSDQPETPDVPPAAELLARRWARLRARALDVTPVMLPAARLSLRAARLVAERRIRTVQELLALDPDELIGQPNVGRRTLSMLLDVADWALGTTGDERPATDFVGLVDLLLAPLPERARRIVSMRFGERIRMVETAARLGISRERVRQVEEKFVARVRASIASTSLATDSIIEDQVIEFEELTSGRDAAAEVPGFYVVLARVVLTGGDSCVDAERFYNSQLDLLADEIRGDDDFLLARFSEEGFPEFLTVMTPALTELNQEMVWDRTTAVLRVAVSGGVMIGRKPQVGRLIRALMRKASGPVPVSVLVRQLEVVLAAYGEVSYFDAIRLRNKLAPMTGVHFIDQNTVSLHVSHPETADSWKRSAVQAIESAGRPFSLVRFRRENPDCPFDTFGLASLLRDDRRVVHIGRRLYAPTGYESESSLKIVNLIAETLKRSGRPTARRELLAAVRAKRDLICGQIDNYFPRVEGLVCYTNDLVGLRALDRNVMLAMLASEAAVLSLLGRRSCSQPVHAEELWLQGAGEFDLASEEEAALVRGSRSWRMGFAEKGPSGLFFGIRETR
jgi:hypothetical protein